jgi:hypothetical protein
VLEVGAGAAMGSPPPEGTDNSLLGSPPGATFGAEIEVAVVIGGPGVVEFLWG